MTSYDWCRASYHQYHHHQQQQQQLFNGVELEFCDDDKPLTSGTCHWSL